MPNILIIDDHSIIRVGITFLIRQELPSALIDVAKKGEAAILLLKKKDLRPDHARRQLFLVQIPSILSIIFLLPGRQSTSSSLP